MRQRGAPAPDPKAAAGARCRLKPGYTCQTQDIAGPAGDICDLYAFPSLERSDHLVLVLNVLPRATSDSHFSDAIVYRFRLRPITIAGVGGATAFPFAGEDYELVFTFQFETPRQGGAGAVPVQEGRCLAPSGETTRF